MRLISLLLLMALLGACDSGTSDFKRLSLSVSFQQVGFHPGLRRDLGTYFVVANLQGTPSDRAYQDFLSFSRSLCQDKTVCFVHFWYDANQAALSIPMTDEQVAAQIASYNKNVNSGNDAMQCHPFGPAGEKCS